MMTFFKQAVCKTVFNNIYNRHRKPNEINCYIKTEADSLKKNLLKLLEVLPLKEDKLTESWFIAN